MSITYPYEDYLESISETEWSTLSQDEVGFRLVLGEVRAERLLKNRYALAEGVGITYTVQNRLNPDVYDPEEKGVQTYAGCGPEGDFASCATGQRQDGYYEYNVMGALPALNPRSVLDPNSVVYNPFFSTYGEEKFAEAADVAYAAYYLAANQIVPDPTGSAIEYMHESSIGSAVFFAPGEFLSDLGVYFRDESKRISYTEMPIGWNQPPPYRLDPMVYEVP
jgi:hypothetical protein